MVVENPAGSVRQWRDREARMVGVTQMRWDYGFIEDHVGSDGDEVDCYLGPNEEASFVYVIHQRKAPDFKTHDEDKVMLGFGSEEEAKAAYLAHRNDGDAAYGGMTALPLERFKAKLSRRTGSGKIRHEAEMSINFDSLRGPDGKVRTGVWDRFTTWGSKLKDRMETRFDEQTLPQMVDNWKKRGDHLPLDYNHQSSYAAENGQPAPALAWYNAMAVVRDGQLLCFQSLDEGVQPPQTADLADGLWGHRSEVTELGQELLPNFKYISPTFSPDGTDEQGNLIGYTIHAVAATNTPFQSGTGFTFAKGNKMALTFEAQVMGMLGLEAGADDEAVKAAYARKLEEAKAMLADGEPEAMKKMADDLMALAGHHEAAFGEPEGPHVAMRKLAERLSKMAGPEDEAKMEGDKEEPAKMEDKKEEGEHMEEAKMEQQLRREYSALANRLGVRLPDGATSKQMFDAISAATVPAAQLPVLVDARVKQQLLERDRAQAKATAEAKAKVLVEAAIEGGYPEEQRSALLNFASDPKSYAAAEAMVKPFLKGALGENSLLFQKMTASGAPQGADPRREGAAAAASGKDRRVVRNQLATFVVEGERFSNMAKEWADAKEGAIKMEIDALLSDSEQAHPGHRLIAANKLLKDKRPDLWAAAEEQDL